MNDLDQARLLLKAALRDLRSLEEMGYSMASFEPLQTYTAFAMQLRYEALLENDAAIDREGAIALARSLYDAANRQIERTDG